MRLGIKIDRLDLVGAHARGARLGRPRATGADDAVSLGRVHRHRTAQEGHEGEEDRDEGHTDATRREDDVPFEWIVEALEKERGKARAANEEGVGELGHEVLPRCDAARHGRENGRVRDERAVVTEDGPSEDGADSEHEQVGDSIFVGRAVIASHVDRERQRDRKEDRHGAPRRARAERVRGAESEDDGRHPCWGERIAELADDVLRRLELLDDVRDGLGQDENDEDLPDVTALRARGLDTREVRMP